MLQDGPLERNCPKMDTAHKNSGSILAD